MYFHDYDTSYDPSIPVVEIAISVTRGTTTATLLALVDSGADATVIPIRFLDQIGATPVRRAWLRSATGERHSIQLYEVYLQIGTYGQYCVVVGDTFSDEAAVGRDILNRYIVKLDGPAITVEFMQ